MTTNNEVKAPRPCTLWGQTFNSNKVYDIKFQSNNVQIHILGKRTTVSKYVEHSKDLKALRFEAIQAIASAQRPCECAQGDSDPVDPARCRSLH